MGCDWMRQDINIVFNVTFFLVSSINHLSRSGAPSMQRLPSVDFCQQTMQRRTEVNGGTQQGSQHRHVHVSNIVLIIFKS